MKKSYCYVAIMIVIIVAATMVVSTSSSAAIKGKVSYRHGVKPSLKATFGEIVSTKKENNMRIDGYISYYSGPYKGKVIFYPTKYFSNRDYLEFRLTVGKVKGKSLFDYYVDSKYRHTSTSWWSFDYR